LGLTGLWNIGGLGGSVLLDIPCQSSEFEYTDIRLQVTAYAGITEMPTVNVSGAVLWSEEVVLVLDDPPGSWNLHQSRWVIYPAQEYEQVILTSNPDWGSIIDQVVVDTISVTADCIVDFDDLVEFSEQWLEYGSDIKFDLNNSGQVDLKDFSIFAKSWRYPCPW